MTPKSWDPNDLPETYYILGTLHGFNFVMDLMEGERVGEVLDKTYEQNNPVSFIRFKDYTGAVARVQVGFIDSFFMSTEDSRRLDQALAKDRQRYDD